MTNGVIRMTHPEGIGLVTRGKSYDFVFEKRSDSVSGIAFKMKKEIACFSWKLFQENGVGRSAKRSDYSFKVKIPVSSHCT